MEPVEPLTDAHLTRRAQAGETGALGLLLARHQARMHAVALNLLGHGPDAEDVVQDAALTALRRIGDVRDPDAVGAWLRAIVRNNARMRLRSAREVPGLDGLDHLRPHLPDDHEQVIEQHALRDWIWDAIGELTPKLRLVVMLHYFTATTSYEDIAAACDIPVGTVRSRLNQARSQLARLLLATADQAHDDAARRTKASHEEGLATLTGWESGTLPREISELWPAHSQMTGRLTRPGEHRHSHPGHAPLPGGRRTPAPAPRHRRTGRRHLGDDRHHHTRQPAPLPADPLLAHAPPGRARPTAPGRLPEGVPDRNRFEARTLCHGAKGVPHGKTTTNGLGQSGRPPRATPSPSPGGRP
ncbi:RNA polymerase sigma factor [Streptomyces sp. KL116D]|uniref:RNA polymerase sigma factor n=1 Tax=Streptomyces sp. KL116D TaxID=3045152 RepID=UPI003556C3C2